LAVGTAARRGRASFPVRTFLGWPIELAGAQQGVDEPHEFAGGQDQRPLVGVLGRLGDLLAPEQLNFAPVPYRSRDGGQTWEPLAVPSA
jgi:hypothetical protein